MKWKPFDENGALLNLFGVLFLSYDVVAAVIVFQVCGCVCASEWARRFTSVGNFSFVRGNIKRDRNTHKIA